MKKLSGQSTSCIGLLSLGGALLSGGGDDEGSGTPATPVVYMWITSSGLDGDLGGVSGADQICENESSGIGLPSGNFTHRAVLASSSFHPRDISGIGNRRVQRPDGTVIIDTYTNFLDSSIDLDNNISGVSFGFWTGLASNGNASTDNCNDWMSNSGARGEFGASTQVNNFRLRINDEGCVVALNRLLCISYE